MLVAKNRGSARLDAKLQPLLDSRRARGILRDVPASSVLRARAQQIDFSSNDYLSLSTFPKLRNSFIDKIDASTRVLGSGGSRLLDGGTLEHALLEERLAAFFESPAALLYTSGYDANVGFFGSVPLEGDVIVYDSLIHASVHDGMRTSRAARIPDSLQSFDHNSLASLRSVIHAALSNRPALRDGTGTVFIAVESLYSMDGDIAPLREICDLVEQLLPNDNGYLVVDEAHATGIYGRDGRGLVASLGLEHRVAARLHTFGKALASSGAVFLTSKTVRSYLVNYSRPQVFTTAMTYANVANLHAVFDILESGACVPRSERLRELYDHYLQEFRSRRFPPELIRLPWVETVPYTPIIPLLSPLARPLALYLQERGFLVRSITHPTVPKGQDRVRVCLHANNTKEEITSLLDNIQQWIERDSRRVVPPKL